MSEQTAPEWRDCADPDELAAAVAAGVEVLAMGRAGDFPTANQTADQFAGSLRAGITYRIPTSWSPEPPAPDDLAARARRHADGHPESRELELLGEVECTLAPDLVGLADGNEHPVTIPPDGCEVVWLPSDVVDEWVGLPTTDYPPSLGQARATIYACREAQARRGTTPTPDAEPMIVDDWSNDEQMAEECGCSHTLGQHEYGAAIATCEVCGCNDFHSPSSCRARTARPNGCPYDGIGRPPWEAPTPPPAPDEVAAPDDDWCEAVLNDLNSIIHGHCGSDGSDDAHCDWVNDLANEVVRYFQRHDVLDALSTPPPDPPTPPDGCDAVWLPTDVVDGVAEMLATYTVETSLRDACREAQARRGTIPTPEWLTPEVVGRIEDAMLNGDTEDPPPTRTPSSLGDAMRLIGRYTESEGGDSPETTNARRGLFSGYDAWVGAGRPESTTPPPAPPWPGAVLSGLTDEDGVPTWLAQAGQVRGEQVRACTSVPWLPNTSYGEDEWVEVRAPRAVPEPETERVPWWESVGRVVRDATGREAQILRADVGDGAGPSVYAYHDQEPGAALRRLYAPVNGSGTVEVLKDGDR